MLSCLAPQSSFRQQRHTRDPCSLTMPLPPLLLLLLCLCRFKEDVALMKSMGVKYYRMSIAWSRIFPNGKGKVRSDGGLTSLKPDTPPGTASC